MKGLNQVCKKCYERIMKGSEKDSRYLRKVVIYIFYYELSFIRHTQKTGLTDLEA